MVHCAFFVVGCALQVVVVHDDDDDDDDGDDGDDDDDDVDDDYSDYSDYSDHSITFYVAPFLSKHEGVIHGMMIILHVQAFFPNCRTG